MLDANGKHESNMRAEWLNNDLDESEGLDCLAQLERWGAFFGNRFL
jgi:hypothetical protein